MVAAQRTLFYLTHDTLKGSEFGHLSDRPYGTGSTIAAFPGIACQNFGELSRAATIGQSLRDKCVCRLFNLPPPIKYQTIRLQTSAISMHTTSRPRPEYLGTALPTGSPVRFWRLNPESSLFLVLRLRPSAEALGRNLSRY